MQKKIILTPKQKETIDAKFREFRVLKEIEKELQIFKNKYSDKKPIRVSRFK
jgi:hypothetical protein